MATYIALIVEDEELIRTLAIDSLTEAGFTVLEAEHAEEALKHLHAKAEDIHLLFTDIHMPGRMNGLALAHHTKRKWPRIAILIASGYPSPEAHELPSDSRFLPKPYNPVDVISHAQELVGMV